MRRIRLLLLSVAGVFFLIPVGVHAQNTTPELCPRPAAGSTVPEPVDLRSENGVLKVELTYRSVVDPSGQIRYCYSSRESGEAPTLRREARRSIGIEVDKSNGCSRSGATPGIVPAGMTMAMSRPCANSMAMMTATAT